MRIALDHIPSFWEGTLRFMGGGQIGYSCSKDNYWYPRAYRKSHIPILGIQEDDDISDEINDKAWSQNVRPNDTLFVEPKARITRDLLRNSSYKITIKPENANVVVIPAFNRQNLWHQTYDIVAYNKSYDRIYAFRVAYRDEAFGLKNPTQQHIDALLKKVKDIVCVTTSDEVEYFYNQDLNGQEIWLIPNVQSYVDIILNTYPNRAYCEDEDIYVEPITQMSVETLEIASHIDDNTVLEKWVIGSDWHKYPLTLSVFLKAEHDGELDRNQNRNLKMVLENIERVSYWSNPSDNKIIQPDDWDMLQKWILHKLGIDDDTKGFVPFEAYNLLKKEYRPYIRARFAVSALPCEHEQHLGNLKRKVESC